MKVKITLLLLFLSSFCLNVMAQQNKPVLLLTNAKTGKSIKVCEPINPDKVEAILGKAITLEKEVPDDGDPPYFVFKYDGLLIELQDDKIKKVDITNKKWKLNSFTTGNLLEDIAAKHEKHDAKFVYDKRFKVKDSKAVIFVEIDNLQRVTKLGVVFQ
ncbi:MULTISPECIES: hypothetical protein [unclassified Flavobacterium]|uniref:hypothetical protein n=1 Tax=unclassified Flavobacterium TaxID=196869 RepID=UPI0036072A3E